MNLKVLYGGLSKETNKLIEDLIEKSPKHLVGSNLGKKVTRVALRRALKDSTVSIVLLNEDDYTQMKTSLSDDRLVCVISDDTIINLFESKYGVSEPIEEQQDEEEDDIVIEDITEDEIVDEEEVVEEHVNEEDSKDMSWEEIMANFERLGKDHNYDDEEDDLEDVYNEIVDKEDEGVVEEVAEEVTDRAMLELPTEHKVAVPLEVSNDNALKTLINNLKAQIEEQQEFIDESVSKEDYQILKQKNQELEEQVKQAVSEKEEVTDKVSQLNVEKESLESQLTEVKGKFAELMKMFESQQKTLEEVKAVKTSKVVPIKRRYPNVEFIVPLSSNSVIKMYEYVASIKDDILFIDLTNNSYIDNYIKTDSIVKPTKWLTGEYPYKKVVVNSISHKNIRFISQVVHEMDRSILTKLDWDKVLGDLVTENRVIINIGSIYDNSVVEILKAVEDGVTVKCFLGELKRDQRIGTLALPNLSKYKVLASKTIKDNFNIITERY